MKQQPSRIKILHISPILLGRFGDKKNVGDMCKGKPAMCFFAADTAVCNVFILLQISLNT
jgi:hypothetical protein